MKTFREFCLTILKRVWTFPQFLLRLLSKSSSKRTNNHTHNPPYESPSIPKGIAHPIPTIPRQPTNPSTYRLDLTPHLWHHCANIPFTLLPQPSSKKLCHPPCSVQYAIKHPHCVPSQSPHTSDPSVAAGVKGSQHGGGAAVDVGEAGFSYAIYHICSRAQPRQDVRGQEVEHGEGISR